MPEFLNLGLTDWRLVKLAQHKLSQQAQALERSTELVTARRAHSAVESAINGLEVHGLDMCQDHGYLGEISRRRPKAAGAKLKKQGFPFRH